MKPLVIGVIVVVIILVAAGAWYVYATPSVAAMFGLRHSTSQITASTTPNANGYRNFGNPGGFAMGSIETLNGDAFTLTLADGTTKNINITATTTLENYTSASSTPSMITIDQLSVGEQVFVMGSANTDGSITAARVLTGTLPVRPTGGRRPRSTPEPD